MSMSREQSPLVSRRTILTTGTAAAAVASAPGALAGVTPSGLSSELAVLKREYGTAHAAYLAASQRHNEAETCWCELKPARPEELLEPFGYYVDPITKGRPWTAAGLRKQAEVWRAVSVKHPGLEDE